MANRHDIAHRFANKLEGKNGRIAAGNVRYEGRNYFSYSTVFGQWLDIEKNVVAIFDGSTSPSSSKHKLWKGVFPDDVHVFPLAFSGGWSNCNLVSSYNFKDEDFKEYHRMQMIDHYVERIYDQIAAINGGKSKGLENVSFEAWDYIEELCSLYKDTSISKYLKWTKNKDYKKLAKLLKDGECNVEVLTDALFGEGTFKKYMDYCERFRKADRNKQFMESLCHRLGIGSPYVSYRGYHNLMPHDMSAADIRKLTAKERNVIHFKAIAYKEWECNAVERKQKYNKNRENAFKWIVGYECDKKKGWCGYEYDDKVTKCRSMFTGEEYNISGEHIFGFYWCDTSMAFNYDSFRNSEDKEQWIADFYTKCKEVADNRKAILTLKRINAHTKEKVNRWDDDVYINDDYLRENTSPSEYILCSHFIYLQNKHYADEAARERAREIERLRREEEERKEREYMERVKQEQIDELSEQGIEGVREIWRRHYMSIEEAKRETYGMDGDFFYGGNVLLRLNLNKDKVETSKNIRIPVEVCKKMWKIVSKWHENPSCFKSMQIDTKGSGKYTISSYEDDILTAGCHKIAYTEMERMYNEIINA